MIVILHFSSQDWAWFLGAPPHFWTIRQQQQQQTSTDFLWTGNERRTSISGGVGSLLWSSPPILFVNQFARRLRSTLCQSPALKLGLIEEPAQRSSRFMFVSLIPDTVPQIRLLPEALALSRVWYLHYTEGLVIISELNVMPVRVCWHFRCWMCTNEPWLHLTGLRSLFHSHSDIYAGGQSDSLTICLLEMLLRPDLLRLWVTCCSCGCHSVIQISYEVGWMLFKENRA